METYTYISEEAVKMSGTRCMKIVTGKSNISGTWRQEKQEETVVTYLSDWKAEGTQINMAKCQTKLAANKKSLLAIKKVKINLYVYKLYVKYLYLHVYLVI